MSQSAKSDVSHPGLDERWSELLLLSIAMAAMIGGCVLLFQEMITFSASLDALTQRSPSDTFVLIARVAAVIVLLVLLKDTVVAFFAFGAIACRTGTTGVRHVAEACLPKVSVIVPAYNEGEAIEGTLGSLLALDYPNYEIIVVDDGSTDDTLAKAKTKADASRDGNVAIIVLTQPNMGKWQALNAGIAQSSGELVMCIDADSVIAPDALRHMVPHFDRAEIGAVSGQVQVRNKETLIARLQALEYVVANGSARTAQSGDGCVLIVPGPIGVFRRATLDAVCREYFAGNGGHGVSLGSGPFSPHTFAEDFELSVMICALGSRIVYESKARAFTRVPETLRGLLDQRYRWLRGSMQVARRYRSERWRQKGPRSAMNRWMTVATVGELYLVPMAGLLLLGALIWSLMIGELQSMLTLWLLVWLIQTSAAVMFIHTHREDMRLSLLTPIQSLYNAMLLSGVWPHAFADQVRGRTMKW